MSTPIGIKQILQHIWPKQWQRLPNAKGGAQTGIDSKAVFLHYGDTPPLYYYWQARYPDAKYIDTQHEKVSEDTLETASALIIVRHISLPCLRLLHGRSDQLPPVIYFFDDDVPGILKDLHIPLKYSVRTALKYVAVKTLLDKVNPELLVSTEGLAGLYGIPPKQVLPPTHAAPIRPEKTSPTKPASEPLTIFYHGTTSHIREILWLRDILADVSQQLPSAIIELFGDSSVRNLYRDIPRAKVVHPMSWPRFFEYTSTVSYDIGLAPLLDSRFNRARSYVKFFDITRTGAMGIYSDTPVFSSIVQHEHNGLLVENDQEKWSNAICSAATNLKLRQQLTKNAYQTCSISPHPHHRDKNHE